MESSKTAIDNVRQSPLLLYPSWSGPIRSKCAHDKSEALFNWEDPMKLLLTAAFVASLAATTAFAAGPEVPPHGSIVPREIAWLASRPSDGPVLKTVRQIAADYAAAHPGFKLDIIETPDRPSYLQKLETLAAARQLPEFFDTDATPFAQKLQQAGLMVNAAAILDKLGLTNQFRPVALNYQRFSDGSLYMIPLEFGMEVFWYNKSMFEKAGIKPPNTLDDVPALCTALAKTGVLPVALDGVDGWPPQRMIAWYPFREAGGDYIKKLRKGDAKMGDAVGSKAAEWLASLATAGCFSKDFSSQGYTDARDLFTQGKAAIYYMGTWEAEAMTNQAAQAPSVRGNIAYFTLPMIPNAKTGPNEFFVNSGIGMAIGTRSFDPLVYDFVKYLLSRYPELYANTGALSPMSYTPAELPNKSPLYAQIVAEIPKLGAEFAVPWDTQLDPTSNTVMQQQLTLLLQGNSSAKQFTDAVDAAIADNAPRFFNQ
jgi:raffinose/stachyose/melibiose transport system substrate-binding protein